MNQREASKQNWQSRNTIEEINSGSLQRIADATEIMAQNHVKLQEERDRYYKWYKQSDEKNDSLLRKNAALRGVITKLKEKLSEKSNTH